MVTGEGRKPILKSIDELVFDPKNPRLPTSRASADEADIFRYMLDKGNIIELMLSLSTQGYFDGEPLLVVESESGRYDVVEGNRRLAALKLLRNPSLAPIKQGTVQEVCDQAQVIPENVPVIIYDHRSEILRYLGYRHITGIKDWDSLAKAKYLSELVDTLPAEMEYKDKTKELAKIIGSRSDYVDKLLSGYEAYKIIEHNKFYGIQNLNEEDFSFSLLTTATSYQNIAEFLTVKDESGSITPEVINEPHLKDLTEWIFKESEGQTRLRESRNLKYLNAIVSNPRALKEFKAGTAIEVAWQHTEGPTEFFSKMLEDALKSLGEANKQMHLIEVETRHLESLDEISKLARDMKRLVSAKLSDLEED